MTYDLIPYEPRLKTPMLELLTQLWSPRLEANADYFEWKYERNPYVGTPLIYLATYGDKVVGLRGFFGTQWESGVPLQKFIALYADDLVIAPEHRNRGLFPKIMAMALKDLAHRQYTYSLNLSASPLNILFSMATGWSNVGSVQPMRQRPWQRDLIGGCKSLISRLPFRPSLSHLQLRRFSFGPSLETLGAERIQRSLVGKPWLSYQEEPRCEEMAELIQRIGSDGRIRHVRDKTFLEWRFRNPFRRYRFLFSYKSKLEGYLVLQEASTPYEDQDVVSIVDWEGTSIDVQMELLEAAMKLTAGRSRLIWTVSLAQQAITLLEKCGFAPTPLSTSPTRAQHCILVRHISGHAMESASLLPGRSLIDIQNWDLRMLYSMRG